MNCKKMEQLVYFAVDGLLDGPERGLFKDHLSACDRCQKLYSHAKESLSILKQPLLESNKIPCLEVDSIVAMEFDKIHVEGKRLVFFMRKKWAIAASVLLALGVGYWLRTALVNMPGRFDDATKRSDYSLKGEEIATQGKTDSLLSLGPYCRMRLQENSRALIRRNERKVVKVELVYGRIICAARKGIYDTIMVGCAGVGVFAVGTHFCVEKQDSGVRISVLEGAVKVIPLNKNGAMAVNSRERCFVSSEGKCALSSLTDETQRLMAEEFATMAPRHVNQGANGVSMENGVLVPFISSDTARPYVLTQGKNRKPAGGKEAFHDSLEALYHYAIVESMMKKGKFENAVYVILDYLATYGTNHDRAYGDLGLCYLKIARPEKALRAYQSLVAESRDPEAVETALHKINAVRFLKLDDYSHAEQGIREYLGKYPGGTWRESELYYLIKIYLYYKKDLKAARILAKQYLADFPATCRAREITSDMAEIDRAASR